MRVRFPSVRDTTPMPFDPMVYYPKLIVVMRLAYNQEILERAPLGYVEASVHVGYNDSCG